MNTHSDIEIRQVFEMEDFGAELTPELREQEERLWAQAAETARRSNYGRGHATANAKQ